MSADLVIVRFHSHPGVLVPYEAVRLKRTTSIEIWLKHGSDPSHPVQWHITLGTFNSSLMSHAAVTQGLNIIEMPRTWSSRPPDSCPTYCYTIWSP